MLTKVDVCVAANEIDEAWRLCDTKPPGEWLLETGGVGDVKMGTSAGVGRLGTIDMRSAGGGFDIAASAGTGINEFRSLQLLECGSIQRQPLGLDQRTFVPIQTQPLEISNGLGGGPGFDSWRVNVFDAKDNAAAAGPSQQPGDQIGAGVSKML